MPYIVTTHHWESGDSVRHIDSRRAVATLDEARAAIKQTTGPFSWRMAEVEAIPEAGGTVGPLPDGTVIEVERVPWHRLDPDGALDESGEKEGGLFSWEIIACFNAAQAVS